MSGIPLSQQVSEEPREPVLDTIDRVSELCFGLFMVLTFVGSVKAVTGDNEAGMKMFYTALGCNLAWGLADAVMFLIRTLTHRGQRLSLALAVRDEKDPAVAVRLIRDSLPKVMKMLVADQELEAIRRRLAVTALPEGPRLHYPDLLGAIAIFVIIVLSTFPVALPFVLISDVDTALFISRALTLIMLFGSGIALGRHAGFGGWKAGMAMVILGVLLTMAIIALGG